MRNPKKKWEFDLSGRSISNNWREIRVGHGINSAWDLRCAIYMKMISQLTETLYFLEIDYLTLLIETPFTLPSSTQIDEGSEVLPNFYLLVSAKYEWSLRECSQTEIQLFWILISLPKAKLEFLDCWNQQQKYLVRSARTADIINNSDCLKSKFNSLWINLLN